MIELTALARKEISKESVPRGIAVRAVKVLSRVKLLSSAKALESGHNSSATSEWFCMVFQDSSYQLGCSLCPRVSGFGQLCDSLNTMLLSLIVCSGKVQVARDDGELNRFGFSSGSFSVEGD